MSTDERAALRLLLDAIDARDPDLPGLIARRPREGVLFGTLGGCGLSDDEWILVLVALAARLAGRESLTGQELVAAAAPDSAGRLRVLSALSERGTLERAGLLFPHWRVDDGEEAQETVWRLGSRPFRLACRVFGRVEDAAANETTEIEPYLSNAEILRDLRRLSLAYRRRAARAFYMDPFTSPGIETDEGLAELVRQADSQGARVSRRLTATNSSPALPVLLLRDEFQLNLDELVILATILFEELLDGVGSVDAIDLVKLVSVSETQLVRRRGILRPLARRKLLSLEGGYGGKDLTADASLPNAVVDRMLGTPSSLSPDDRIDFHRYLKDLDSSEAFYLDLDRDEESDD